MTPLAVSVRSAGLVILAPAARRLERFRLRRLILRRLGELRPLALSFRSAGLMIVPPATRRLRLRRQIIRRLRALPV